MGTLSSGSIEGIGQLGHQGKLEDADTAFTF